MSERLGFQAEAPVEVSPEAIYAYGSIAVAGAGSVEQVTLDGNKQGPDGHEGYHS